MKKVFTLFTGILISTCLFCQTQPEIFKIGDYVEILKNDNILVYFNCTGTVSSKKCAEFFRVGKIDSVNPNVSGKFHDYYMNGNTALEATIENNNLNGEATYFYESGNIKSKGKYKQNRKIGVWTYYYDNGIKKALINYVNNYPFISEYYNKKGKQKVVNGNGEYKGEFCTFNNCTPFRIWGEVLNGKMEGKWMIYNSHFKQMLGHELYKDGKFVKGVSGDYIYTDQPKISINGYNTNENLHLEENYLSCPGDYGISFLKYKSKDLHQIFYPELFDTLSATINKNIHNQWLIVGLRVNKDSKVNSIRIKSSINDTLIEKTVSEILKSKSEFTAAELHDVSVDFDLFFTILIRDDQIIIPADYIYRSRLK